MENRLSIQTEKDHLLAAVSGRVYDMHGAFPSSILVAGEEILAAPVRLRAEFDGVEQPWDEPHILPISADAHEAVYTVQQAAGNAALNARVKIESDGLIWIDFMMIPFGRWITYHMGEDLTEPHLTSLKLEIPLTKKAAELYHYWPILDSGIEQTAMIKNSGAVPEEGFAVPLKPVLWLGREECGFALYMESEKNMQPADPKKLCQVRQAGDAVLITVDLLDSMPRPWQGKRDSWYTPLEPVEFTLGMQATPVKPYKRLKDFEHVISRSWYDLDHMTDDEIEQYASLLQSLGVKWHTLHEDWTVLQNYGLSWDEKLLRKFIDAMHRHGIKVMAYFGYECASIIPTWFEKNSTYLLKAADGKKRGGWQRLPHQRAYMVCYAGDYSDVMLERVAFVMDNYGVDGIYTDGTYIPWECANEAHGCGWRDADGVLHESYPVRKVREHVKKLHKIVHDRGGIVEAHQSSCCAPMLLSYADSYFDGEHIQHVFANNSGGFMNTAAMRSEFSGRNFGLSFQFLSSTDSYSEGCGIMLLHNSSTKVYGNNVMDRLKEASEIWRTMDNFGADTAAFTGYWQEGCPARADTDGVLVSAWSKPGATLAVAVNMTGQPQTASVSCGSDSRSLELAPLKPVFIEFSK